MNPFDQNDDIPTRKWDRAAGEPNFDNPIAQALVAQQPQAEKELREYEEAHGMVDEDVADWLGGE